MFRFGSNPAPLAQASNDVDHAGDEEWQDWMDWSRLSEGEAEPQQPPDLPTPRTSSESSHQLPSPRASVTSEVPPSSKKRKTSSDGSIPSVDEAGGNERKPGRQKTSAQYKSHSAVEKRYRTNLNEKIMELGDCIPGLKGDAAAGQVNEGSTTTLRHKKETVLVEAMAYIKQLELKNQHLERAHGDLLAWKRSRQKRDSISYEPGDSRDAVPYSHSPPETLISEDVGTIEDDAEREQEPQQGSEEMGKRPEEETATPSQIQGLIRVPDEWRKMWRGELKSTTSSTSQPSPGRARPASSKVDVPGKKYLGRLMLGSVAGIMLLDGISSSTEGQGQDRGLFALPALPSEWQRLFESTTWTTSHVQSLVDSRLFLPLTRAFLLFGILGLLLFIYLFNSKPPRRKPSSTSSTIPADLAPSVASPLEVRQRAFLTAIQTIWFPTHRVLPEMLALNIETAAYLVRQLLGWRTYSYLTGRSEEQEVARVRAWNVAIDAQLSGGDMEISKSRLVLSLWASGTLPNSPTGLMLKALHIRILFWRPSRWDWLNCRLHCVASRLARWQWSKGRKMMLDADAGDGSVRPDTEPLTPHLKALLSQPVDAVLSDENIRRAHNLTWNTSMAASMCEDTAMRGPLDALAVWYSTDTLNNVLEASIQAPEPETPEGQLAQLATSLTTSPAGSTTKLRALATTSVLHAKEQERLTALQSLAHQISPTALPPESTAAESLPSTFNTILDSLPTEGGDYADIKTCVHVSLILMGAAETSKAEQPSVEQSDHETLSSIIESISPGSGTLAWASISHLVRTLHARASFTSTERLASETLVEKLHEAKELPGSLKTQIHKVLEEVAAPSIREGIIPKEVDI